MKRLFVAAGALVWSVAAIAQQMPQSLPASSVLGRLGNGPGPAQAIPFSVLYQNLLQTVPANPWTIKMNNSASAAVPTDVTIDALTIKSNPASLDEVPIWDSATSTMKKATLANVSTVGSVASINGLTGTLTLFGAFNSGNTLYTPQSGGYLNKLRNSSLVAWFHGCVGSACTITTSGGWCAEGIYVKPTGASVTCQQQTASGCPTGSLTYNCVKITSAASVTAIQVRFVVESYDAAPLAGQQTTFQFLWKNACGASVTPTIQANYPTAQDNYTSVSTDLSSANLQATTNGTSQTEAYSWAPNSGITAGDSIDIGFGACGASNSDSFTIAGGFDWRATPGPATGTVSSPPTPEIRTAAEDI